MWEPSFHSTTGVLFDVLFIALLPTSIILSIASHLRGNKLWAWSWTVLAILGGLGIIAFPALFRLSIGPNPTGLEVLAYFVMGAFVLIAWVVQLVVIGIVALVRKRNQARLWRSGRAFGDPQ